MTGSMNRNDSCRASQQEAQGQGLVCLISLSCIRLSISCTRSRVSRVLGGCQNFLIFGDGVYLCMFIASSIAIMLCF